MKFSSLFILALFLPWLMSCSQQISTADHHLSIMTWNIRYNNPGDGVNAWPNRKAMVFSFLKDENPPLICLQEVLAGQLRDLARALPRYSWLGAGRDDGKEAGEYVPVFYDKFRFRLLKGDHFWLSESPRKPGKPAWDAACTRMVTWVQLQDKYSDSTLFVFNTHFDHVGVKARELSAHLLVQAVDSLAGDQPVIITGDFNSSDKDAPHEVITGAGFKDSRVVSATDPVGPVYTWTGFEVGGKTGERIDFIYVRNTQPVLNHVVHDDSSGGHYLSDHLPVIVRF